MMRGLLIASLVLAAAACGRDAPPLVASDVIVKAPMPGMEMTAGYLTLRNNTDEDIVIERVTSPQFEKVEMHETVIDEGVAKMSALGRLVVPGDSEVAFEPGGKHLMLMRPNEDLATVTLEFYSAGMVVLTVNVASGD